MASTVATPLTSFRGTVTADGSSGFKAEKGRYHLVGGYFCPWAQRAMITRKLKGLEDVISFTSVTPKNVAPGGWAFGDGTDGCDPDPIFNAPNAKTFYLTAHPTYEGRYSVPVLFDKQTKQIVNNESADILRILNTAFNEFATRPELDLNAPEAQKAIEEVNAFVLPDINYGVFKSSMGDSDEACDAACQGVSQAFARLEGILSKQRYVAGSKITEADVWLMVSLIRYDILPKRSKTPVKQLSEYPILINYVRELYQMPAFKTTSSFDHTIGALSGFVFKEKIEAGTLKLGKPDIAAYEAPHNRATITVA